jgi:GT2 family glycosyltransferase
LYDPHYPSRGDSGEPCEVDWISSACLLVRRSAALEVGGVDESFYMYSDETDLQYRLHGAGWKVYYLPGIQTVHLGGQSASHWRRRRLIYRGKLLFFAKHRGPARTMMLRLIFLLSSGAKAAVWGMSHALAWQRERARNEARSHLEVASMCVRTL